MFDFDKDETGSLPRYLDRMGYNPKPIPRIKHLGWWWTHNCIAHPLIGMLPIKVTFDFHDWTSRKLNAWPRKRA
jgi:hypothetical protein